MHAAVAANFPSLSPTMVSTAQIVSICPFPLTKQMPLGGSLFTFTMAAQPRNGYEILTVADTYQLIRGGFEELSDSNPTPSLMPAPIRAGVLAQSLVAEWSRTLSPVGSTGVRVMPNGMVEGSLEFKAMLVDMSNEVRSLAEWAIRDAGDKYGNNEGRYISDDFHRKLATWLMGEDGARAIPWYNAQAINELKPCIACGDSINATAKVCKSCGTDLIKYFLEYELDASADPIVAAVARKVKRPAHTEATHSAATVNPLRVSVNIPNAPLSPEIRVAILNAMSGEQKADMQAKKGQDAKDEFMVSLVDDLCLKNANLKATLMAKGFINGATDAN